jgi:hypothetical protein
MSPTQAVLGWALMTAITAVSSILGVRHVARKRAKGLTMRTIAANAGAAACNAVKQAATGPTAQRCLRTARVGATRAWSCSCQAASKVKQATPSFMQRVADIARRVSDPVKPGRPQTAPKA